MFFFLFFHLHLNLQFNVASYNIFFPLYLQSNKIMQTNVYVNIYKYILLEIK